ncbi:MAG: type II and III secretion system protein family protein [Acidobacteria bacterium]|nr:type II and III secretion system protein family protein [Acidobacteriota bacterium]
MTRFLLRIVLICLLGSALCSAQTATQPEMVNHELAFTVGRGQLLRFAGDVVRVVVAEPKIADAVVVSPRALMVNAKGAGRTTLVVWESGLAPATYDITVRADTSEQEDFELKLRESLPGARVKFTASADTIVLTGTVKDRDQLKRAGALAATRAKTVVNLLEAPALGDPRQILLQVKFASVDRVALSELGFNYFSTDDKMLGAGGTQQFQAPRFSQLQFENHQFSNATVNFADLLNLFVFRPDLNIGATIRALQSRNLLQILAEPNLITIEGSEASFLAGGEFPFPTITSTSTGGATAPVITVQFKKFGIQLTFTPTVTASGAINLKVAPEVSSLDFSNGVTLQGLLIPAISSRRAETEVLLKDGESFAIAGLIDNRVINSISKVRGLGDIPILGQFFRSRSSRKSTDELVVVITPHFVRPLSPEEKAKLPTMVEPFLPSVEQEKAKKLKGKARSKKDKAEFVGPRGHQEPK